MKHLFRPPTALELAQRQFEQSQRVLLYAQARVEEWQAQVDVMDQRCSRLRQQIEAGKIFVEVGYVL